MEKKVVFYNTTIDAVLKYGSKALLKMDSVFRTFQKWDHIVLLWRPHPLLESTLRAMRPELVEEYLRIVSFYKDNQIGIYDDSAGMYSAIAISDAYYGDWSSVLEIYKKAGKPIFIQNIDVLEAKKPPINWAIAARTFSLVNNEVAYFSPIQGNTLFQMNLNNGIRKVDIMEECEEKNYLYHRAITYENEIIFSPCKVNNFLIYDTLTNKKNFISLKDGENFERGPFELRQFDNKIYAVSICSLSVYQYDKGEKNFKCLFKGNENKKLYSARRINNSTLIAFLDREDNKAYIFSILENMWYTYSLPVNSIKEFLYDKDIFWAITEKDELYRCCLSNGEGIKITLPQNCYDIVTIVDVGDYLKVFTKSGNKVFKIKKYNYQIEEEEIEMLSNKLKHFYTEVDKDIFLVRHYSSGMGWFLRSTDYYTLYNYVTGKTERLSMEVLEEGQDLELIKMYTNERWVNLYEKNNIMVENAENTLYLLDITLKYTEYNKHISQVRHCGTDIHKKIKGLLENVEKA